MAIDDPDEWKIYNRRIAILPGDPRIAYRPKRVVTDEHGRAALERIIGPGDSPDYVSKPIFDDDGELPLGQWYAADGVADAPGVVDELVGRGYTGHLDIVYFANATGEEVCPPHPAIAANPWGANPWGANPWGANPWGANPWGANPWGANPWGANPWGANPEELNIVATGRPPTSSVMPAPGRTWRRRHAHCDSSDVVVGVLDSGLAGPKLRPELLADDQRITGDLDLPSRSMGGRPADHYLDPVAGHGTFIAGIIEQLTPGCTIEVRQVFEPQGDVGALKLTQELVSLMKHADPDIVCLSLGGTGRACLLERHIEHYSRRHRRHHEHCPGHDEARLHHDDRNGDHDGDHDHDHDHDGDHHHHHHHHHDHDGDHHHPHQGRHHHHDDDCQPRRLRRHAAHCRTIFVASAGNEGSCVEQFPAAMPEVVGVGALGPTGPAPWSNYGPWLDASAPGTDLVSCFFADFDGALPPINGMDQDEFDQWATWSGTSFAGPVVVAALANDMITNRRCPGAAVQSIIHAPHLTRLHNMGTIVNY